MYSRREKQEEKKITNELKVEKIYLQKSVEAVFFTSYNKFDLTPKKFFEKKFAMSTEYSRFYTILFYDFKSNFYGSHLDVNKNFELKIDGGVEILTTFSMVRSVETINHNGVVGCIDMQFTEVLDCFFVLKFSNTVSIKTRSIKCRSFFISPHQFKKGYL